VEIPSENKATLTFKKISAGDAAVYTVIVTNAAGSAFAKEASITIEIISATGKK
jgi:hypothetical protein